MRFFSLRTVNSVWGTRDRVLSCVLWLFVLCAFAVFAHAAQVTIESDITDATDEFGPSPTVVFTTNLVGYIFFIDATNDLVYRKTSDGGTSWAAPVAINTAITGWTAVSVWYDQWTPGDTTGTKIHIAAVDDAGGDAHYTFLDTSGDTLKGSMVLVINQTTFTETTNGAPSITRGAGGALFLSANFATTAGGYVSKSTDGAGDTWSDVTPSAWSTVSIDQIQLLPLLTDNDIIAIRADTNNNDIDSRIYDEVGDTWDGSWTSIGSLTENTTYDQWFSAAIKKSTGDVYVAFNNNTNNAANDIDFWSLTDSGRTWSVQTDVVQNDAQILSPVTMVDEVTGDIYVAYIDGTIDFIFNGTGVNNVTYVYYKKSTDGGVTWSSETGTLTDDIGDDYKYLRGNMLSNHRLYVAFYDDDEDDIFGSSVMAQQVPVEANIDTAIVDATDEYGPSPAGVFINDNVGYHFSVRAHNVMLDATDEFNASPSIVFTTATVGYIFFVDYQSQDLVYRKTSDGGLTWSGSRTINSATTGWTAVSVWYDQWTPGDTTGTKIHIAASDDTSDDVFYTFLDTNGDSLKGSMVLAISGTTTLTEEVDGPPSITKGGGGALFMSANFTSTVGGKVSKSTDGAGNTWNDATPSGWSSVAADQIQLLPLSTDNDIIAIRADTANNEMDSRIYDEVGDAWAGSWTSIAAMVDNATYDQWFSATLEKATGDIFLTFTNNIGVATGDIEFWVLTDSGRTWAKSSANVVSDLATILAPVALYKTDTNTIYVAYARGTLADTMQIYFKSSTDDGASWSAESSALSTTGDDFKAVRGNLMNADILYVAWYNDDTNTIRGDRLLSIQSYDLPITTAQAVVYRKTSNGGRFWELPYTVSSVVGATALSVWYDQWTPGDTTGTKIHIAFSDDQTGDYYYTFLDTATDTVGTTTAVLLGTTITEAGVGVPGITKGANGNLFLLGNFNATAGGTIAKSTDGGTTWVDATPSGWSSAAIDQIQLLPLLTDNDVIAIRADTGNNDIDYRIYDEVGDAWAGSWTTIASLTENTTYDQWFSAAIKKSTGNVYLALNNNTANAANDIDFWSFTDSGRTWTERTDVFENSATIMMPTVFVDESNSDLYVAYLRGTLAASMDVYFKKSMDGGVTWSGESASLSPGIFDDLMSLRGNLLSNNRLYAFLYNDDLNDVYGNTVEDTWSLEQVAYRFFANANSTDVGSALAGQNTAATLSSGGDAFRLRLLLHSMGQTPTRGDNLKLQFAEKSGTCDTGFSGESYADVTAATVIAYNNNATPADGAALTANANDPTHSGHTVVNQTYEEANNATNSEAAIPSGQDGKWDFSLIDNGATPSTSYCLRVVESDGTQLRRYSVIPEVTTAASGGSGTLTFSISDNTVGFGDLSSSAARYATGDTAGSGTETVAHTIAASTNASNGYVITVQGATLTSGSDTITAIGGTSAASSVGTEQYGLRITASGGNGAVSSPYNHASNYAYGADASTADDIASDPDGDDVSTTYSIRYLGNISATTESGSYSTTPTFVITAGF